MRRYDKSEIRKGMFLEGGVPFEREYAEHEGFLVSVHREPGTRRPEVKLLGKTSDPLDEISARHAKFVAETEKQLELVSRALGVVKKIRAVK